ncbi:MAG: TonB-dependent receptor [Desulfobacter sp.]|nr:TonB-dependent receptor [Desulfobacter sp.]WDP87887.1 MAG: TonB-dependent receptor [Desulfobacter sp.]
MIRNASREYENVGETDIKGLETTLRYMTPWNLDLGLGYTYMTAKDKDSATSEETDAEFIPDHKFTLDARYFFDFGLTAALQLVYTGEQYEYENSGDKYTISDFTVVNAKLNQAFSFTEKISSDIFIEVKNLFDENYEEGSGPMPGRNFLAGISFNF